MLSTGKPALASLQPVAPSVLLKTPWLVPAYIVRLDEGSTAIPLTSWASVMPESATVQVPPPSLLLNIRVAESWAADLETPLDSTTIPRNANNTETNALHLIH